MRLIDADEFFKYYPELAIEPYINAPTVTDRTEEVLSLQNTIAKLVEGIAENAKPQGEWKITQDEKFYHYKCPFCGFWATGDFLRTNDNLDLPNFCEKCGVDLRGDKND